eukprot:scaffold6767_cov223-Isochrysis_galbana.AAC.3
MDVGGSESRRGCVGVCLCVLCCLSVLLVVCAHGREAEGSAGMVYYCGGWMRNGGWRCAARGLVSSVSICPSWSWSRCQSAPMSAAAGGVDGRRGAPPVPFPFNWQRAERMPGLGRAECWANGPVVRWAVGQGCVAARADGGGQGLLGLRAYWVA